LIDNRRRESPPNRKGVSEEAISMSGKAWRWVLVGCALVIGCESSKQIGSTCKNGVCPQANAVSGPVCSVSEEYEEILVTSVPEIPQRLAVVCLAGPHPVGDDGKVACEVRWTVQEKEPGEVSELPEHCSDAPYLERIDGEPDTVCRVHQLTTGELAAGKDGWYYDVSAQRECRNGASSVRLTGNAIPGPGKVLLNISCVFAQAANEGDAGINWTPIDECGPLPASSASHVGDDCSPQVVPEGGFDDRVASVHIGVEDQCGGGACLVYHFKGDPSSPCDAVDDSGVPIDAGRFVPSTCPRESELRDRVYCTCRCDAPEGEPECACPHGFSCQPALADVPGDLRGGYCVKDGT
jgi:hypothetical protein